MKNIVWKDLFKPRYAIMVELVSFPSCNFNSKFSCNVTKPVVKRKPYKRPLTMSFKEFQHRINNPETLVVYASKLTMSRLYGIGSTLPHNLNNPIELE